MIPNRHEIIENGIQISWHFLLKGLGGVETLGRIEVGREGCWGGLGHKKMVAKDII